MQSEVKLNRREQAWWYVLSAGNLIADVRLCQGEITKQISARTVA
nr:MAG TPA_asm: hypothetical protein [Caudoviricetes sp.]